LPLIFIFPLSSFVIFARWLFYKYKKLFSSASEISIDPIRTKKLTLCLGTWFRIHAVMNKDFLGGCQWDRLEINEASDWALTTGIAISF